MYRTVQVCLLVAVNVPIMVSFPKHSVTAAHTYVFFSFVVVAPDLRLIKCFAIRSHPLYCTILPLEEKHLLPAQANRPPPLYYYSCSLLIVVFALPSKHSREEVPCTTSYSLRKGKHADGSLPRLWQLKKRMVHFYRISTGDVHPWSHRWD